MKLRRLSSMVVFAIAWIASPVSAAPLFLESLPAEVLRTSYEGVQYSERGVGFAGIRFDVDRSVAIGDAAANFRHVVGHSNRYFMGIEALDGPGDDPDFVLDGGSPALVAYDEASAPESSTLEEVRFRMGVTLTPGTYALLLGCVAPECRGGLFFGPSEAAEARIPLDDFLVSFGDASFQSWVFSGSGETFRMALYHPIPEPALALLLGTVVVGLIARGPSAGLSRLRSGPRARSRTL